MAYQKLIDGKSMRDIFEENGIDPDILGSSRIWGFAQKLRANADREEGFTDLCGKNFRKPAKGEYSGAAEPLFRKSGNRLSGIGNRRIA